MKPQTTDKADEVKQYTINWIGLVAVVTYAIVLGFIGMSLPTTINLINHSSIYGYWASYPITCLLFLLLTRSIKLVELKET